MGIQYRKRINLGGGLGLNLSKSGISTSLRTKIGSVSSRGYSIKTGIPGLYIRGSWKKGKNRTKVSATSAPNQAKVNPVLYTFFLYLFFWPILIPYQIIRLSVRLLAKPFQARTATDLEKQLFQLIRLKFSELPKFCIEIEPEVNSAGHTIRRFQLKNITPKALHVFDYLEISLFDNNTMNVTFWSSKFDVPHEVELAYWVNSIAKIYGKDESGLANLSQKDYDSIEQRYDFSRDWLEKKVPVRLFTNIDDQNRIQYGMTIWGIAVKSSWQKVGEK